MPPGIAQQEYLVDGRAEEIITALSRDHPALCSSYPPGTAGATSEGNAVAAEQFALLAGVKSTVVASAAGRRKLWLDRYCA